MSLGAQLFNVGASAVTGNYVGAAVGLAGVGLSLFGGDESAKAQKEISAASAQNAQYEGEINAQKKLAMQLSGRRQQLETIRNAQRARAYGAQAAATQGANKGSGFFGGQYQETSKGSYNLQGIQDNLDIGTRIFGINDKISANNAKIASLGGKVAEGQAYSSLGNSLSGASDAANRLSGQFFAGNSNSGFSGYDNIPQAGRDF